MYTLLSKIRHLALLTAVCLHIKSILNSSRWNLFDLIGINQRDQNLFIASWKSSPATLGEKDSWTLWAGKERGRLSVLLALFFTPPTTGEDQLSHKEMHIYHRLMPSVKEKKFSSLVQGASKNFHSILRASNILDFSNITVFEVVSRVTERVMSYDSLNNTNGLLRHTANS